MFCINDLIVYENGGVCQVADIGTPDFVRNDEKYYILQPVNDAAGTLYVKVENDRHVLRPIISRERAEEVLSKVSEIDPMYSSNDKLRNQEFKDAIRSCNTEQWFSVLKGITKEKFRRESVGKKLNMSDERNLQKVGKLLTTEYAVVLEIPFDEARKKLENLVAS